MNTLLTEPEPATSPTTPHTARLRLINCAEPRARILYIEDEPQLRRLGELVLARSGYDVDTAADGAEGWEALQHAHYNLLITDNNMPRLTGLELITLARRAGMRLPIVLTSGSAHALSDPSAAWLELAACLPKPFGSDTLLATVGQALRAANNMRQCSGTMISVQTQFARIQPYPHGGIND
jgi:DNA-binding response OmpR family regulator